MDRFTIEASPLAHPDAIVQGDHWRITVLTDGLLRLEWSDDGVFCDLASTFALHRDLPVPKFRLIEGRSTLEIITERLHLTYDRQPFSPTGLTVDARGGLTAYHSVWRYGEPIDNEGGTARTLDGVDGRLPLEPGVVSRQGVSVIDDSESFCFTEDGWVTARASEGIDLYVFVYGHDHAGAVRALYDLSGRQPVIPRWALGNWWSRYYAYSAEEYLALMDRFDAEHVPLSVAVLDMDWHLVDDIDPRHGSGWTGYTWNRKLFPDPAGFLDQLHRRGLHTTLNVHPADGVRAFEDAYPQMCAALGHDPADGTPIAFDITDPDFLRAYFSVLHHPLEDQGVDFWWLDWQQGRFSRIPGVDPLWMLNHFHYLDSGRHQDRRPLTFSRYAGPGSHRYPVGFSGDTVISWASLAFQPEFTATAANIGYGWWSHDIGGHYQGSRDDNLTVRWLQFGVFSPIMRLHSSNNPFLVKEPWGFRPEARATIGHALRLRHRLVPYLHTMNHHAHDTGTPLVRPMYHLYPDDDIAYETAHQYAFGSELLVVPITTPDDPVTLLGEVRAWLPPGQWIDLSTETVYDGDRELNLYRDTHSIPVLVKAGGILPLATAANLDPNVNPAEIEVVVAPGSDGRFVLIEDDGTDDHVVRTPIVWSQQTGTLTIGPMEGSPAPSNSHVVPPSRRWVVRLLATANPAVVVQGSPGDRLTATFEPDVQPRTTIPMPRIQEIIDGAQYDYEAKLRIWEASRKEPSIAIAELQALDLPAGLTGAITEVLSARW